MTERVPHNKSDQGSTRTKVEHMPDDVPASAGGLQTNILRLQSVLGNAAVQRLLNRQNGAAPKTTPRQTPLIQRAPQGTGLLQGETAANFAGDIRAFCANPTNAAKPTADLLLLLEAEINEALQAVEVPALKMQKDASATLYGVFNPQQWTMAINETALLGEASTIGAIPQEQLNGLVNTLYHEARHAEQNFRIAQMLAGQMLPPEAKRKQRRKAIEAITQETHDNIAPEIVEKAVEAPLFASEANQQLLQEAQTWLRSMYGIAKVYANFIDRLRGGPISSMVALIKPLRAKIALPPEEKAAQQSQIDAGLDELNGYLDFLVTNGKQGAQNIAQRIRTAPEPTPEDEVMLRHLATVVAILTELEQMRPITDANLETLGVRIGVGDFPDSLDDELVRAKEDLPHEQDSGRAGEAAQDAFTQSAPQQEP